MIYILCLIIVLSAMAGKKEALLYSMKGAEGVKRFYGGKFDHLPWIIERVVIGLLLVLVFFFVGDLIQLSVIGLYWMLSFPLAHQISYNEVMHELGNPYYPRIYANSTTTTAKFEPPFWLKVAMFIMATVGYISFVVLY